MSSPRVHKASLVDPSFHSPALLELVDLKLSRAVVEYLIDTVVETVDYALGRPSHSGRGRSLSRHSEGSAFATCVRNVLERAEVEIPVVLAALAYLDRAKPHLHIALEEWANERVFLGALIVASKYLNDSSLKNVHWAVCTGVFGKRDIGRIEREFLDVLDFELGLSEADILAHHDAIMSVVSPVHRNARHHAFPTLDLPTSIPASPSPTATSTAASFSPRTPLTLVEPAHIPAKVKALVAESSPAYPGYPPKLPSPPAPAAHPEDHAESHDSYHPAKRARTSSTMRLLRSFPLPRPLSLSLLHPAHHSVSHHQHDSDVQMQPQPQLPSQYDYPTASHPRCQAQPVIPPLHAQQTTRVCV